MFVLINHHILWFTFIAVKLINISHLNRKKEKEKKSKKLCVFEINLERFRMQFICRKDTHNTCLE